MANELDFIDVGELTVTEIAQFFARFAAIHFELNPEMKTITFRSDKVEERGDNKVKVVTEVGYDFDVPVNQF